MADKVSILDKDGVVTYYSTYGAARAAIISLSIQHPLIQIWATLTNEQIVLLNGVDIWIAPGVTLDYLPPSLTTAAPTITDNGVECHCQIYGTGVLKNTFVGTTGNVYECIKTTNADTELEVNCDYIEGVGKVSDGFAGVSVRIENGEKFHLTCNKVYNQNNVAMYIGSSNPINDLNFRIEKVETGIPNTTDTGTTAIITRGNGYIMINEILCRNLGHCFSHRGGDITARIEKMSSTSNISGGIATLHVPGPSQGTGTQTLVLYFDHIDAFAGSFASGHAAELKGGKVSLIGGKINSSDFYGVICGGVLQEGFIKCNEILSVSFYPLNLGYFDGEVSIIANSIIGNYQPTSGFSPVVNLDSTPLLIPRCSIKNSFIRNLNNAANAKGIYFENTTPVLTLNNVKIVAGTQENNIIYLSNGSSLDIKNYGLYGNKVITDGRIHLKIGNSGNFLFVDSTDLT